MSIYLRKEHSDLRGKNLVDVVETQYSHTISNSSYWSKRVCEDYPHIGQALLSSYEGKEFMLYKLASSSTTQMRFVISRPIRESDRQIDLFQYNTPSKRLLNEELILGCDNACIEFKDGCFVSELVLYLKPLSAHELDSLQQQMREIVLEMDPEHIVEFDTTSHTCKYEIWLSNEAEENIKPAMERLKDYNYITSYNICDPGVVEITLGTRSLGSSDKIDTFRQAYRKLCNPTANLELACERVY